MDDRDLFVFEQAGSDGDVSVQGNEFSRNMVFFYHKWIAVASCFLSVVARTIPLIMTWVVVMSFKAVLKPETMMANMAQSLRLWVYLIIGLVILICFVCFLQHREP
jgi:hypothetical protein